jgi:superfamily I DNA/RNA helicase
LYWLFSNQRTSIQDFRLVKEFPSYEHYKAAAKETRNAEMTRLTKIVEEYGRETPALLEAITANTCEIEQAQITLTTAHRSKGLQADRVQLAEDFPELRVGKMPPEVVDDETNLLYVAMTRCRQALGVPEAILDQIR